MTRKRNLFWRVSGLWPKKSLLMVVRRAKRSLSWMPLNDLAREVDFGGRLERSAGRDEWTGLPDGQLILLSFRAEDEFAWVEDERLIVGDGQQLGQVGLRGPD